MKTEVFLVFIVLFFGCEKRIAEEELTSFDITRGIEVDEKIFLSELASDIRYIPLETTTESLISGIGEVAFSDKYILVTDNLNKLLLFNIEGKFLRQIGTKGHGPFEYVHTSKAVFSANGEDVVVFDGAGLKLIRYSTSTGNSIREARINRIIPRSLDYLNDTTIAFWCSAASFPVSGSYCHVYLMDNNFQIIDSLYCRPDLKSADLSARQWGIISTYKNKNDLYFHDTDSDTIFRLNQYRIIEPAFELSFDKYKLPPAQRHTQGFEQSQGIHFFYDKLIETDQYLFIEGVFQGRYAKYILFDKITGKTANVVFNYDFYDRGFHNDLDGGIPFWPKGKIDDQTVYATISPFELKRLINNQYFKTIPVLDKNKHNHLLSLLEKSDLADNPFIVIVRLK